MNKWPQETVDGSNSINSHLHIWYNQCHSKGPICQQQRARLNSQCGTIPQGNQLVTRLQLNMALFCHERTSGSSSNMCLPIQSEPLFFRAYLSSIIIQELMKKLIHQHGIPHNAGSNQEIHFIVQAARTEVHSYIWKPTRPWSSLPYGALNSPTASKNWSLLGAGKQCPQTLGSKYLVVIILNDPLKCFVLPIFATGISKDRSMVPKDKLTKGHINQGFH